MKCSNDRIKYKFLEYCDYIYLYREKCNVRKTNYYSDKMNLLVRSIKENVNYEIIDFLISLLDNNREDISIYAAVCLLKCNIKMDEAKNALNKICKKSKNKYNKVAAEECIKAYCK